MWFSSPASCLLHYRDLVMSSRDVSSVVISQHCRGSYHMDPVDDDYDPEVVMDKLEDYVYVRLYVEAVDEHDLHKQIYMKYKDVTMSMYKASMDRCISNHVLMDQRLNLLKARSSNPSMTRPGLSVPLTKKPCIVVVHMQPLTMTLSSALHL
jgi:hypothetical protein